MNVMEESLQLHKEWKGKIEVVTRTKIENAKDLTLAYTPGVAQPCLEIEKDPTLSYELTGMPVMEGKCALFKAFADVDAFPICLDTNDVDTIVDTIAHIAGSFGGINLEDIAAPRCFEIEAKLKERLDIPVFHDDQHGTAIVVGAAMLNACKLTGRKIGELKVVMSGAGAAGCAIAKFLLDLGVKDIIMLNSKGIICEGDDIKNPAQAEMAKITNREHLRGGLADAMKGADVFVGVSKPDLVTPEMVKSMNDKPFIFAMSNPVPEIMPDKAKAAGAYIVGTGRSDFPNQINNVVAFPGIFKGALAVRASDINEEMKLAAARAIADCVSDEQLGVDFILPNAFDRNVSIKVAEAVAEAARESGVARI